MNEKDFSYWYKDPATHTFFHFSCDVVLCLRFLNLIVQIFDRRELASRYREK